MTARRMWGMRLRMYPNATQERKLERTMEACRYVWNKCLEWTESCIDADLPRPSTWAMHAQLPALKRAHPWLRAADAQALQNACKDLDAAWRNAKRHPELFEEPKYRGADAPASYRTAYARITDDSHVKLPKIGYVHVRGMRTDRMSRRAKPMSATMSQSADGRWWCSLQMRDDIRHIPDTPTAFEENCVVITDASVGIATTADEPDTPRTYRRNLHRIQRQRRRLERCIRGSARYERQRRRLARAEMHLTAQRHDWLHKLTNAIVTDTDVITLVRGQSKGKSRNKAQRISDRLAFETMRQLAYKTNWHERTFVSTDDEDGTCVRTCFACGTTAELRPTNETWTCKTCESVNDTRKNALDVASRRLDMQDAME